MAELSIVIIVGCCPYIPRIFRLRNKSTSYNVDTRNTGTIGGKRKWKYKDTFLSNDTADRDPTVDFDPEQDLQGIGVTTTVSVADGQSPEHEQHGNEIARDRV